jgi:hypothetical protein
MDFYTNMYIDEAKLRSNVQLAGEILAEYGVTSKGFCEEFYGLDIIIRADENWSCDKIECYGAAHEIPLYLETDRRTKALLHEILHAIEFKRGVSDTVVHKNWDKKGFYQMDRVYMTEYDPVN